jgi:hypothetical protein
MNTLQWRLRPHRVTSSHASQVVNKAWLGAGCSYSALRAYLEMVHSVYVLLHGPIAAALEQVSMASSCQCLPRCQVQVTHDAHLNPKLLKLPVM